MQTRTVQKVSGYAALLLLSFAISGHPSHPQRSAPIAVASVPHATSRVQRARTRARKIRMIASWYGEEFLGQLTASGEQYDPDQLTAANRTLPFGSLVKLTASVTGRSVVVRINDRGPWAKDRDFDVSEAAARELGIREKGIAAVEATLLGAAGKQTVTIAR